MKRCFPLLVLALAVAVAGTGGCADHSIHVPDTPQGQACRAPCDREYEVCMAAAQSGHGKRRCVSRDRECLLACPGAWTGEKNRPRAP